MVLIDLSLSIFNYPFHIERSFINVSSILFSEMARFSFSSKLLLASLLIGFILCLTFQLNVYGEVKVYDVSLIDVTIDVSSNGRLIVTERITINYVQGVFSYFYRDIPFRGLSNIYVTLVDAENVSLIDYDVSYSWSGVSVKAYYRELHAPAVATFILKYEVDGAIFVASQSQNKIDWMAVGLDWSVPIRRVDVVVNLPGNFVDDPLLSVSPEPKEIFYENGVTSIYFSAVDLPPHVGFRVIVVFPKIYEPPVDYLYFFRVYPLESSLLIALSSTLIILGLWFMKGRMPKVEVNESLLSLGIMPSNLTPAEASFLVSRGFSVNQVMATLIDLANRGYLVIEYDGDVLRFKPTKKSVDGLSGESELKIFEKEILKIALRAGNSLNLRNEWVAISRIGDLIEEELVRNGYFKSKPRAFRTRFIGWGVGLFVIGLIVAFVLFGNVGLMPSAIPYIKAILSVVLGISFSGISLALIGYTLFSNYTLKGAREYKLWKIYFDKLFKLNRNLIDRLPRKLQFFERHLPFVISLRPHFLYDWGIMWYGYIPYWPTWFVISRTPPSSRGIDVSFDFGSFIGELSNAVNIALKGFPTSVHAFGGGFVSAGGGGGVGGASGGGGGGVG